MTAFHNGIRRFFAFVIGLVLFASGCLKLLDPVGTGLIVSDYFKFFHTGFLSPVAGVAGALLALLEGITGASLITGAYRKFSALSATVLIGFFTVVTLILWVSGTDMDCGCFGRAIRLTPAQSLLKNLVLALLAVAAFIPYRDYGAERPGKKAAFILTAVSLVFALCYNAFTLPVIDFAGFPPGAELYASQDNDYQAEDGLMATYIYEKDGKRGSFSLDRLPDSTWTFVAVDTIPRNGMKMAEDIPVLSFTDADGEYQDEQAVLGKVAVISVPRPSRLNAKGWETVSRAASAAREAGAVPLVLASDRLQVPADFSETVYQSDFKTLVSLNRSNGGLTYIDNGMIVKKFPRNASADPQALGKAFAGDPVETTIATSSSGRIKAQAFLLYTFALMLLL